MAVTVSETNHVVLPEKSEYRKSET